MPEIFSKYLPITLVYLGMGLVMARILLEGTAPRRFIWMKWLHFLLDACRIVLLWPLVLFIEKLRHWLESPSKDKTPPSR